MLNEKGIRELCYIVNIDAIEPIVGSDNCEAAIVGGWKIMTRKETFKPGDMAVYFEIDSKVPEKPEFEFLAKKHYKIKTQKYTFGGKGNFISQGLLMSLNDFPNLFFQDLATINNLKWCYIQGIKGKEPAIPVKVGDFLTDILNVKYSVVEDNKRKSTSDKYKKMAQRHWKLFKHNKLVQWLYGKEWGKKLLFFFLGNKQDKKASFWPEWVRKTDEERCQNLPQLFPGDETIWMVTEKIDGSSTTFTLKKGKRNKNEFYVCSRNVCFDKPEKENKLFYDTNIYTKMAEKYNVEEILTEILNLSDLDFVTLQGETYGAGVQKRDYGMQDIDFAGFNLIYGYKNGEVRRLNPEEMKNKLDYYNIPSVPVLDTNFKLPQTIDEMIAYADGPSKLDGEYREGVVLRTLDGVNSFKAVSNEYLLKKGE